MIGAEYNDNVRFPHGVTCILPSVRIYRPAALVVDVRAQDSPYGRLIILWIGLYRSDEPIEHNRECVGIGRIRGPGERRRAKRRVPVRFTGVMPRCLHTFAFQQQRLIKLRYEGFEQCGWQRHAIPHGKGRLHRGKGVFAITEFEHGREAGGDEGSAREQFIRIAQRKAHIAIGRYPL